MSVQGPQGPTQRRAGTERAIQGLVLFSTVLGVLFLIQVNGALPTMAFDFVAVGWVLFVVDSVLTFVAPRPSYGLAFILGVLALTSSLPQSAHYAFIVSGEALPSATFILGSAAQVLLVVLVPYHFLKHRKK